MAKLNRSKKAADLRTKRAELLVQKKRMESVLHGLENKSVTRPVQLKLYQKSQRKGWKPLILTDRIPSLGTQGDRCVVDKDKFLSELPSRLWNQLKARENTTAGPISPKAKSLVSVFPREKMRLSRTSANSHMRPQ